MAAGYTNSISQIQLTVRGGTAQPAGVEGMIWVKTANAVTSWTVSSRQPGKAAQGMVWIKSGAEHGINILRKNAVEVFPSGCKQYIGGAWKNALAYLYTAGTWTQFEFGKLDIVKGGKSAYTLQDIRGSSAVITQNSDHIYVSNSGAGRDFCVGFKNIDCTNYKTIRCMAYGASSNGLYMRLSNDNSTYTDYSAQVTIPTAKPAAAFSMDISSITGSKTIKFNGGTGTNGNANVRLYDLWLEG